MRSPFRTTFIAAIAALGFIAPPLAADNYTRQPRVDVQSYVFRVTLSDDTDEIVGETTVNVLFVQDGLQIFWLDLASPAGGKGMRVSRSEERRVGKGGRS